MTDPSLVNLARATGKDPEELGHMLTCAVCRPERRCDDNPALIAAAIAAYRGGAAAPEEAEDTSDRPRRDRHVSSELFPTDRDPRKKS